MIINAQTIKRSAARVVRATAESALKPISTFARPSDITATSAERPITPQFTKSDWLPIFALLSPGLVLAVLLGRDSTRPATIDFVTGNWGNIASVWGLVVSFYLLFVATGARRAAQQAVSAERRRTALAGLKDAAAKCAEVGQFAVVDEWAVVSLRAQEVMTCCRTTLAGWGEVEALTESRNNLNQIATFMESIIEETRNPNPNRKAILAAQLKSVVKLSVVVGKIQKQNKSGSE
jgi:hypothetical protein